MYVSPIAYWYFRLRHPKYKLYLDMGYGIEARFLRCQSYWTPHLEYSRNFIQHSCENLGDKESIAVLGSGRTYDVDVENLASQFKKVHLYDADPRAVHFTKGRYNNLKNVSSFLAEVQTPHDMAQPFYSCVLSLNMLSQIPLYRAGEGQVKHLELLKKVAQRKLILITDRYWHSYDCDTPQWETEEALRIPWGMITDLSKRFAHDSWFWHIVPAGIEEAPGSIHEVHATSFDM